MSNLLEKIDLFDSMSDLIAVIDNEYRIVKANRPLAERLGATPGECVGMTCYSAIHGTDEPVADCPLCKLLNDGRPHTAEVFEEKLGGYMEVSVSPLRDENGALAGCIHTARDFNEQRRRNLFVELNNRILQQLNNTDDGDDVIENIMLLIKGRLDVEAIGIRVREGDDYTFTCLSGFSDNFVENANSLCAKCCSVDDAEAPGGEPGFYGLCGYVIKHCVDNTKDNPQYNLPYFTGRGSFYTNTADSIPAEEVERELGLEMEGPCLDLDFKSLALVPLLSGSEVMGLIQLNDSRPGVFDSEFIEQLEHIGESIGIALKRRTLFSSLIEREKNLEEAVDIINRSPAVAFRWRMERDWPVEYVSDNVEKLTGITAGDFTSGKARYSDIIHPDDIKRVAAEVEFFTGRENAGHFVHKPYRIVARDGAVKWVEDSTNVIRDDSGAVVQLKGLVIDITDRIEATREIKRKNELLETINNLLQSSIGKDDIREVGKSCLDAAETLTGSRFGFIVELNDKGLFDSIAISDPGWEECRMSEEQKKCVLVDMEMHGIRKRVLEQGKTEIVNDPASDPGFTGVPEGHPEITSFLGVPLKSGGRVFGLIAVGNKDGGYDSEDAAVIESLSTALSDLLLRKKGEMENEKLKQQLFQVQKMESVGRLAGGIAHEFNNMLGVIMGYANLALMDLEKGDRFYDEFSTIMKSAERSKDITMKLLAFARKDKLSVTRINAVEIVDDLALMLRRSFPKSVEIATETEDCYVDVDINLVQQVLLNVCGNALDAMPRGGRIYIKCASVEIDQLLCGDGNRLEKGRYCRFTVVDEGEGIPEDALHKVFDPFYTTREVGKGTGLGLSISHGIVENHNGCICIDSAPGRGTTVDIYLPAVQVEPDEAKDIKQQKKEVRHGLETVLVVDDELYILEILGKMLHRLGYKVKLVDNGREAINVYKENSDEIDIVILDLMMPEMDGRDVFFGLKEIDPDVKIILASGYSMSNMADELLEKGARAFIQKPFEIKELSGSIRQVLA